MTDTPFTLRFTLALEARCEARDLEDALAQIELGLEDVTMKALHGRLRLTLDGVREGGVERDVADARCVSVPVSALAAQAGPATDAVNEILAETVADCDTDAMPADTAERDALVRLHAENAIGSGDPEEMRRTLAEILSLMSGRTAAADENKARDRRAFEIARAACIGTGNVVAMPVRRERQGLVAL